MTAAKTKTEAVVATKLDLSKLSFAELQELALEASQLVSSKRTEEIKVLADGFVKKALAAKFTPEEIYIAMEAMLPYPKNKKAANTSSSKLKSDYTGPKPVPGTRYVDPANPKKNDWTKPANGKGQTKKWLQDYLDAGRKPEEFVAK